MYNYRQVIPGFFVAFLKEGDTHVKRVACDGFTTHKQDTLNIYLKGDFRLEFPEQTLEVAQGQHSKLLPDISVANGGLITETLLSKSGIRVCVDLRKVAIGSGDFIVLLRGSGTIGATLVNAPFFGHASNFESDGDFIRCQLI